MNNNVWPIYVVMTMNHSKAAVSVFTDQASAGADWCHCGCCHPMPTLAECVCCHNSELTSGSLKGKRCITEDRRMQSVVLNDDVLSAMYVQMMLDTGKQGLAPDVLDDKYVLLCACKQISDISLMKIVSV